MRLFSAVPSRDLHDHSPSQIQGENGVRCSFCALRPSGSAPAQSILFLLSHQSHHLQSYVPLVRRNLEPSSVWVSALACSWGWVQEWRPQTSLPEECLLCDISLGAQLHQGASLKEGVIFVKWPLWGTKALLFSGRGLEKLGFREEPSPFGVDLLISL